MNRLKRILSALTSVRFWLDLRARLVVWAAAAVTWLIAAGMVLGQLAGQVGDLGPIGADVAAWALRAAAWAATAVLIIRRVTPVLKSERGLLPPDSRKGN